MDAFDARVSKLPVSFPYAERLFPVATFDLRLGLLVHAEGITRAVQNKGEQSSKSKAFTLSAEIFLMQLTCHWFCKSKRWPRPVCWAVTKLLTPGCWLPSRRRRAAPILS